MCREEVYDSVEYMHHLIDHGEDPDVAEQRARKFVLDWARQQKSHREKLKANPSSMQWWKKVFGESLLKSDIDAPYEITNRNGTVIAQFVLEDWEVQRIIDRYQADYKNEHYGSGDAIVVTASDGQDVSRFFDNTVQEWETISTENIDKEIDYLLGDDNES